MQFRRAQTRTRFLLACMAVAPLCDGHAQAHSLFEVTRHAFCGEVANLEAVGKYDDRLALKTVREPLLFWFEIKVNQAGYRYLKQFGRFPVRIAWGYNGWLVTRPIDVGITPEHWEEHKDAIAHKVKASKDGSFTWRTYAVRPHPNPPGTYYVSISDPNRRPVQFHSLDKVRPELTVIHQH